MAHILFVNDNRDVAAQLAQVLVGAEHSVASAQSANEAFELLRREEFDLVVSDLHVPEIDGIRIARIIRTGIYPTAAGVPIVLVSSTVDEAISSDLLKETRIDEFIHLPCDAEHFLGRVAEHLKRSGRGAPPQERGVEQRTLLVVDDEPDFLRLMVQMLDGVGYRLLTASDGVEALELLRREHVSLVLLDYMLPDTNGIVLLREMRQAKPETPVVMLTGHGSQEVAVEALWAGAADYLEKPVKNQVLRSTIADVLLRGHTLQMARYLKEQIRTLREQADKIERLKRLNEAIVGALPDPICVLDASRQIIAVNPEFWTAFGITPEPGQPRSLMSVLAQPAVESAVVQVMREGRPLAGLEMEYGRGDGAMRSFRLRLMPLLGHHGLEVNDSEGCVLVVFQDITEERRAARMEDQLRSEHEQTRMMGTFVQMLSGAAHELNNPLAVVMGLSDLGRASGPETSPQQMAQMFSRIFENAKRCQKIVKDLTAFLAAERTQLRPGSIYDVLEAALAAKRTALESSNVKVMLPGRSPLPKASMNEQQIRQVFEQVLENAALSLAELGRGGEIKISLGVEPAQPHDLVSVEFANDGPAIPEENLRRIFLPFVSGRNVGQGAGLGLAVCYGIVRNHGGKIRARNLPEGGCAFTVWLPVANQVALSA
ncbi:MAG: response regulator [Candidatus Wallbacteria bacterium]|nr:response regulator [Candidatus Wallbacteria bacterium]